MKWIPYALASVALMGCDLKDLLEDDTGSDTRPDTTDTDTELTDDTGGATDDTGTTEEPFELSCVLVSTSPRTIEVSRAATMTTELSCEGSSVADMALFGVVIGLNTSSSEPEVPLDALLESDGSGRVVLTTDIPEELLTEAGIGGYTVYFSRASGDSSSSGSTSDSLSEPDEDTVLTVSGGEVRAHDALSNPAEELVVPSYTLLDEGFSAAEVSATARLGDFGDGEPRLGAVRRDGNDLIAALCPVDGACVVETFAGVIEDLDGVIEGEGGRWVESTDGGPVYLWWGETDTDAGADCCRTINMKPIRLDITGIDMDDTDESWLTDGTMSARLGDSVDELYSVVPTAPLVSDTSGLPGLALFFATGDGDERQFVLYDNGKSTLFRYFGELSPWDVSWAALLPGYDARDGSVQEPSWTIAALSADNPSMLVLSTVRGREALSQEVILPEALGTPDWAAFDMMDLDGDGLSEVVVARGDASGGDGLFYIPQVEGPAGLEWGEAVALEDPAYAESPLWLAARHLPGTNTTGLYFGEGEFSAPTAVTTRGVDNDPTPIYLDLDLAQWSWPREPASGLPTGKRDQSSAGTSAADSYVGPQLIPYLGDSEATEDTMGSGDLAMVGPAVPGGPVATTRACCGKRLDKSSPLIAKSLDGGIEVVGVNGLSVLPIDDTEPLMQFEGGGFGTSVAVSSDSNYSVVGFGSGAIVGVAIGVVRAGDYSYWSYTYEVGESWSIETPLDGFAAIPLSEEDGTSLWIGESSGEVTVATMDNPLFAAQAQEGASALYSGFAPRADLERDSSLDLLRFHEASWLRVIGGAPGDAPKQVSESTLAGSVVADLPEGWEDDTYEVVMIAPWETGTACPLATLLVSGAEGALSDNEDRVVVLDTSEDPSCEDLALPMVSAPLMGGGTLQHVLYEVDRGGGGGVHIFYRSPSGSGELHKATHHGLYSIVQRDQAPVGSAADVNGDGFADVLIHDASGSLLLMSDGQGGFLNEGDEVSAAELANLLSFVGSGTGQSLDYQDGDDLVLRKRPGRKHH